MNEFQIKLKQTMNEFAHLIYEITMAFPNEERYSTVSQMRRAALSIALNYVEGYARRKPLVRINFLEISYGSLSEIEFLLGFVKDEKFIGPKTHEKCMTFTKEIGSMLWTETEKLRNAQQK
ncbi:MAG: four helix bundle protein [Candidatus Uhrbacteria bacterium]